MSPLFLFVRPPRPLWPFNGPGSAFWPPLAFASMAAALRQQACDWRVEILDAPALQMGWRTLEAEIRRRQPFVVAFGEEAVGTVECLRLARVARAADARVIAGGCFFGHVAPQVLASGLVDVVAHGEGERTVVELADALREGTAAALERVAGISFVREGVVVRTAARALLADLDELPMPAWDLLPMDRYGAGSGNHAGLAAIESSRGCADACDFCVLWRQMGKVDAGRVTPCLRVKSVERLLEEIRIQTRTFGRRHLGWVDPCFNAHPHRPAVLAEALLRAGIRVEQSAWVRADGIVRDAQSGALSTMVRGGLVEMYAGVERADDAGLEAVHKNLTLPVVREAFHLLAQDHPEVFTLGTFVYGLPGDTPATMRALFRLACELEMDQAFYIPLTPLPGTPYWDAATWDGTGQDFRAFGFLPRFDAASPHRALERALRRAFLLEWPAARLHGYWRGLLQARGRRRRVRTRLALRTLGLLAGGPASSGRHGGGMIFPSWYEG